MIALGYIASLSYGIFCLLIAMLAYKFGVPKRYTRKIVHILVGFEWAILYHFIGVNFHFVAVCLIFTALLILSYKKSLMPMISSDSDNAPGTVYYGISMTVMAIVSLLLENFVFAFGIAVFCTSVGDGLAGVIGSSISACNPKIYKNKTIIGTLSAFVFSFASAYAFSLIYEQELGITYALIVGAFAAGLELITDFGLDNITLPLGTAALSYALIYIEGTENYIVPIILTPFVIALVLGKKILTKKGVFAAVALDVIISVSLGNFGFVLLLSFLMLSVVIDKLKKHSKRQDDNITKRGDERDSVQVFANGLIPAVFAVIAFLTGHFVFVLAFNVALAECFSDTAASGLGSFAKKVYDPFRRKKLQNGLSGGMSVIGTVASLIAPFDFLTISLAFGVLNVKWWLISSVCAFLGAVFDSALGSLIQAKYRCALCNCITEREVHCNKKTEKIAGMRIITNDVVNILSVAFSSALSIALYFII